ncbi:hypothetical protein ABLE68_00390 [Nocardioides sp. CN2-186]|uniref:hypothetical protein n=1 Tax=Nocardioides tweenelious TaxID=3156607 RepID=UPI0032B3309E
MLTTDPARLAGDARSILACPATVTLVVEGEPRAVEEETALSDEDGRPSFVCRPGSPIARAAVQHRSALLTLASGLGEAGGADRADTLTLAGRLERTAVEDCDCCSEVRYAVTLDLNFVLLTRGGRQHRVPLDEFHSEQHRLNRGHLQRSVEHANDCHHAELRQAVSHGTGTAPNDLVAVRLAHLTPSDVEIQWVDVDGAHRTVVAFPRTAHDLSELGEFLRRGLHAGLC